ncbi:hypothetical protein M1P56_21380 [Streptomyces sp. HU2014]|uniref:hypothetical protein n=1 Tax=Streptomyces sp. HU2014 TaxID=2939414 RepID=UPI00200C51C5|nr:hypothetical protein [Streptomyces sp. HU2014]UQI46719.1 hypothetical protein M1P56_21380 [Streptomyces sp. HU2014]
MATTSESNEDDASGEGGSAGIPDRAADQGARPQLAGTLGAAPTPPFWSRFPHLIRLDPARKAARRKILGKLGTWFLFAVIFAVLPTLGEFLSGLQQKVHEKVGIFELASKADLYVVAMGLAASSVAQALMHEHENKKFPSALKFWFAMNVFTIALTAFLAATAKGPEVDAVVLGKQSLCILLATLIFAGSSTYLCERETKP